MFCSYHWDYKFWITAQVLLDAYLVPLFTPISGRAIHSLGLHVRIIVPIELDNLQTAPAKRKKGQHPHTATQRTFLRSQYFCIKSLPLTRDYPRKTSKIRNTTRLADPEEATQSSTSSSRTPNQTPQHPKRVLPRLQRILSVSVYVYSVFSVTFIIQQ